MHKRDPRWPNLVFPNKAILPKKDAKFDDSKELQNIRDTGATAGRRMRKVFETDPTDR